MLQIPERTLQLQGACNFRDLGGYCGHGARPLRWRRLFRSDHLAALTAADRARIAELGIADVLDFRGVAERAAAAYELPGVRQHSLAIEPTVSLRLRELRERGEPLTAAVAQRLMLDLYREFVADSSHRYAEFFEHLLRAETPLVFHCTAGKDRTGWAAALLLLALGVPRDVVVHDYLLSNELYTSPVPAEPAMAAALEVIWRVETQFLEAAIEAIERDHGGFERYLQRRLGLTRAALDTLAARYLESAG